MWRSWLPRVEQLAGDYREEMIRLLEDLVRMESPSLHPQFVLPVLERLIRELDIVHLNARVYPGKVTGGYLFARPKLRTAKKPYQLLIGHADTVWPVGTLESMPLRKVNGRMSGPGVYDMKSGLVQIVFALKIISVLGIPMHVDPLVLINSDEETGSRESKHAITRLAKGAERVFVLEPALGPEGRLKTSRRGGGRFTFHLRGKAAHAGIDPGKGASAIEELAYVVQRLFEMNDPQRGITINVGMIEGGIQPNVVAPESKAVVDVRVVTMEDAVQIEKEIRSIKPKNREVHLQVEGTIGRPPMEKTAGNALLWRQAQEIAEAMGIELLDGRSGGGSDGNWTSLYAPTLDGLGGVGDGAHARHEFIFIDKLVERTVLLTLLLLQPVNGINGIPNF